MMSVNQSVKKKGRSDLVLLVYTNFDPNRRNKNFQEEEISKEDVPITSEKVKVKKKKRFFFF